MSHFILKCVCGTVMQQCRCPDKNKVVKISTSPCSHYPSVIREPVDLDKLKAKSDG